MYSDASYGRIKPGEIQLKMTYAVCPEQYDAFDKDGNLIGYLRLGDDFQVDCPECGEETVYAAYLGYGGSFMDSEREGWLAKAKRAIARYYRDREQSGEATDGRTAADIF